MEDFIAANNLVLHNTADAPPTFDRIHAQGWPDLTISSFSIAQKHSKLLITSPDLSNQHTAATFQSILNSVIYQDSLEDDTASHTQMRINNSTPPTPSDVHFTIMEAFKVGQVVLFLKKNRNPQDPSAYRPICLLPSLGKIFEKLIMNRLRHHLHSGNYLHPRQYGFRTGFSTLHALNDIQKAIYDNRNHGYHTALVSIDIKSF
ncbi:uncharacterized protein LOC118180300 [Stegodyphus dumicola]|uniref:uncharacterized protein LOC118180300 n=1 Tax=Stegodyphus dumicola TaxID=202533 RepID=UPI0015AB942F|nr:uncharacterized protein LOC118180300 [Stegodyphus dumicola]